MKMEICNGVHNSETRNNVVTYAEVCENIRHIMNEVIQLRAAGNQTSEEYKSNITELRMQGSFHFLSLKQLNRAAQINCKDVKDRTFEAKQRLDGYNLQLENLQYEISHLHKEITKCLEFRSRHDDIPLVSVKEFYKQAPTDISKASATKSNKHKQTLARLDWELEQRKRLAEKLSELKTAKENIAEEISVKKQHLQTLQPSLQGLLKSSLPLQEALNLPLDHIKKQHDLANLLPRPLFVFFLQAKAYEEACDKLMTVSIEGDVGAAHKFQQMMVMAERKSNMITDTRDDSDSDPEEKDDQDSRRAHKSRRPSESKMDIDSSCDDVLSYHPLQIHIKLDVNENEGPTLLLKFCYMTTLGFAVVNTSLNSANFSENDLLASPLLDGDTVLDCLLPDDYGLTCPNPSATYLLEKSSLKMQNEIFSIGRPYVWVQKLCGREFLPMNVSDKRQGQDMQMSFCHMQRTITDLRKRIRSRLQLAAQIQNFSENVVSCEGFKADFPKTIHSKLEDWIQLSYADYKDLPQTASVIKLGLLGSDEAENHLYFLATIRRGVSATLKAAIVVQNNYPETVPVITLLLDWIETKSSENDQNIREMEAEVNVQLPSLMKKERNDVLSLQLIRLMSLLDIYVETESENSHFNQPSSLRLNRVCPRLTKGPARLKPFLYRKADNTHLHR